MSMDQVIQGGFITVRPAPISYHSGNTIGFTMMSDLHIGAVNVDYALIKKELEEARKARDRININGDIFDFILPGDRKRYTADVLHPRLMNAGKDIIGAAIKWGVELLGPYADLIDMIGCGNHETSIDKYHSFDPISDLIEKLQPLRTNKEHIIHHGGYSGFIDYRLRRKTGDSQNGKHGSGACRLVIFYHHGWGGSAPVTKGMIDFNRKDTYVDSDVIWMGHKHNRFTSHVRKLSCPISGEGPAVRECRHIMTGSYSDTYIGQTQKSVWKHGRRASWAADCGFAPQGKGGARLLVTPRHTEKTEVMEMRVIQ